MLTPRGLCPCGVQQPGQHQGLMQSTPTQRRLAGSHPFPRWHPNGGMMTPGAETRQGGRGERDEPRPQESSSTAGRGHCGQQLELGRKRSAAWKNRATSPCWEREAHVLPHFNRRSEVFSPPIQTHSCQMPPALHTQSLAAGRGCGLERGGCRVCPAHAAPGTRAESQTVAEGITLCFQARDITANSMQSLTTA